MIAVGDSFLACFLALLGDNLTPGLPKFSIAMFLLSATLLLRCEYVLELVDTGN